MNILEAIQQRRSVRSYNGEAISARQREQLLECTDKAYNPFGGDFTIHLTTVDMKEDFKPSTYGVIKGAKDYFTIAMAEDDASALAVGFSFEQVVLKATELGLGTCWIAGTFKNTAFQTGEALPAGQSLRVVCPVGVQSGSRLMERVTRFALGSNNRKPFAELFSESAFGKALPTDNQFGKALEMLRLAPSSTNSQPWRAVVCGDTVHFYYNRRNIISLVDMGIGLYHFYATEHYLGRSGQFVKDSAAPAPVDKLQYLISYKLNSEK